MSRASVRTGVPRVGSALEETLLFQIRAVGLPEPEREWVFARAIGRKWRMDLAWPTHVPPVAAEVEGGTYVYGRHSRPGGMASDCRKYNQAALDGWVVLRFTRDLILDGTALSTIERALGTPPTGGTT